MWRIIFITAAFLFCTSNAMAQAIDTAWARNLNGPANLDDMPHAIAIDALGNVYVAGQTALSGSASDFITVKYSPKAETLWAETYNGPGNDNDYAYDLAVDPWGNIYVTGASIGSGTTYDYATIKYRPDGTEAWVRRYNGNGFGWDFALDVDVDNSGYVYVTGYIDNAGLSFDYATIKYDSLGNTEWLRTYNNMTWPDYGQALVVDYSGNVYVTGRSYGSSTSADYLTVKYDSSGNQQWAARYDHDFAFDQAIDIGLDNAGNIIVTGTCFDSSFAEDIVTLKYPPTGAPATWVRQYNGTANLKDSAIALAIDEFIGSVYVAGTVRTTAGGLDLGVIGYNSGGTLLGPWTYSASATSAERLRDIVIDTSGIYVGGYTSSGGEVDFVTVKFDYSGDTAWVRKFDGDGITGFDDIRAIALDDAGNLYATGYSDDLGSGNFDLATIRYSYLYQRPLIVVAYSPVNLKVTDPTAHFIGKDAYGVLTQNIFPADYFEDPLDFNDSVIIYYPIAGQYIIEVIPEADAPPGSTYSIGIRIDGSVQSIMIQDADVPALGTSDTYTYFVEEGGHFINGDANGNGIVNILDITFLISYLYKQGPSPDPMICGDANCNQQLNILDITYLIGYLYKSGPDPCQL